MELFRRTILFGMGFVAAASILIADDRMSWNYGQSSGFEVSSQVRELAVAIYERFEEPEVRDPKVLEVFVTQKI